MPKRKSLNKPIPVRCDPATVANLEAIIASGLASDRSAAFRVGVASLAHSLVGESVVWAVIVGGMASTSRLFATDAAAQAWVTENSDEDTDCEIERVVLQ